MSFSIGKAEAYGGESSVPHFNVRKLYADVASSFPEREAVVSLGQRDPLKGGDAWRLTYRELQHHANALASWLIKHGHGGKKYLLAVVGSCTEWVILLWTAIILRIPFVPLSVGRGNMGRFLECLPGASDSIVVVQDEIGLKAIEGLGLEITLMCLNLKGPKDQMPIMPDDMLQESLCRDNLGSSAAKFTPSRVYIPQSNGSLQARSLLGPDCSAVAEKLEDDIMILFTSGTTGLPKACCLSSTNVATRMYRPFVNAKPNKPTRMLMTLPLTHVYGTGEILRTLAFGGCIVFPEGPTTLSVKETINRENCTYLPYVRAKLELLVQQVPSRIAADLYIQIGGDSILDSDIQRFEAALGIPVLQSYGMTECGAITAWRSTKSYYGVGQPVPEIKIRVCSPGVRQRVLEANELGELHVSGKALVPKYWTTSHLAAQGSFYSDGEETWFITGDLAILDENGVLAIKGRTKDLIKRGAVSISPVEVESAIQKGSGLGTRVVGVREASTSEELPTVITHTTVDSAMQLHIRQILTFEFGWTYTVFIVSLPELGFDHFPEGRTGKMDRTSLAKATEAYLDTTYRNKSLHQIVATFLQVPEDEVPLDLFIHERLDSIDIVRLAHKAQVDIMHIWDKTFREMMVDSEKDSEKPSKHFEEVDISPLDLEDIVHPDEMPGLQLIVDEKLQALGFRDIDIEDVYPIDPLLSAGFLRRGTVAYNNRTILKATTDPALLYQALKTTLAEFPIFRTFLVAMPDTGTNEPDFHIAMKPSSELWSILIKHEIPSTMKGFLENQQQQGPEGFHHPSQMFQATIVTFSDPPTTLLALDLNHSVFDKLSISTFIDLLESHLLLSPTPFTPSFKLYADTHFRFRHTTQSDKIVDFHLNRLSNIQEVKSSFWPPTPVLSHTSNDQPPSTTRPLKDIRRRQIPRLQESNVNAAMVVKAAIVLLNTSRTNSHTVIFNVVDAGRIWPSSTSPVPTLVGIDGPTLAWTIDIITIEPTLSVQDFLQHLEEEQKALSANIRCPWNKLKSRLGMERLLALADVMGRQTYNWTSSLTLERKKTAVLEFVGRLDWPTSGCFWNCGMDGDELEIGIASAGGFLKSGELGGLCEGVLDLVQVLVDEDNEKRTLREMLECFNLAS